MAATFARSSTRGTLRRKSTATSNCVLDAIIIGGGHNGLVAAAYLQRSGMNVAVFEKRHLLGGAAVTEELIPGFKFSRASYLLSLLRPQIMKDLKLKYHGLSMYFRDPQSFTPVVGSDRSLSLWSDRQKTLKDIGKFSERDASVYCQYEKFMEEIAKSIEPILDSAPLDPVQIKNSIRSGNFSKLKSSLTSVASLIKTGSSLAFDLPKFWEVLTGPASKILNRWFESEPLKATLASDSVIGAMVSPFTPGSSFELCKAGVHDIKWRCLMLDAGYSSYILLHHVMGELDGRKNSWAYVKGGMGSVTEAIAKCARSYGVQIHTESPVKSILLDGKKAVGVVLENGQEITSRYVLSNATPKVTFLDLLEEGSLPEDFEKEVLAIDYSSGVTKINIALSGLPDFSASLNVSSKPHPHHQATIHLNCESLHSLHAAYLDASVGKIPSQRPFIEMTIPSSVDPTIAPPGCHVVSLFTQYTPYMLPTGEWTEEDKNIYCESVFDVIEEYAPGFRKLVVGKDILTPQDLERTFGLTGGNIFHGAMTLDQLYISRPVPSFWKYTSPIKGLYLCGSGAHPGGGVMGSCGRICAQIVLEDRKEPIDT